jgi:hypothetical protein
MKEFAVIGSRQACKTVRQRMVELTLLLRMKKLSARSRDQD